MRPYQPVLLAWLAALALMTGVVFQNCGRGFQAVNLTPSITALVCEAGYHRAGENCEEDEFDGQGCPRHLKPGMNINVFPQRVWDRSRILANFGVDPAVSYSCRNDQTTPYKIDPPVRVSSDPEYGSFMEPLTTHLYRLATITTDYVRLRSATQPPARCAIDWILPWAQSGIFTERAGVASEGGDFTSRQGDYERAFYISNFAFAYGLVKDEPGLSPDHKRSIEGWLQKVGNELQAFSRLRTDKDKEPNNILYWTGYSLMTIGLVLDHKDFKERAIEIYDVALSEINAQGLLPRELSRGSKSFWYHNYALTPLIYMAEVAQPFGYDLYARGEGKIHLLARKMISSFNDFSSFPESSVQSSESTPNYFLHDNSREIGWMEIYYSRFGDAGLKTLLQTARQTNNGALKYSTRTHGSATHIYGVKCL